MRPAIGFAFAFHRNSFSTFIHLQPRHESPCELAIQQLSSRKNIARRQSNIRLIFDLQQSAGT